MTSLSTAFCPKVKKFALLYNLTLILSGSLLIALLAQFAIPLPFSPVPLSLQTLGIFIVAALLGSKKGSLSILTYLFEGIAGLPVFAGGIGGIAAFAGPRGGYLIGFAIAAFLIGYMQERSKKEHFSYSFLSFTLGNIVILTLGALGLSLFVGAKNALIMGIYPFLIGDALKIGIASLILPTCWKLKGRLN